MAESPLAATVSTAGQPAAANEQAQHRALVWAFLANVFSDQPTRETVSSYRRGPGAAWLAQLCDDSELGASAKAVVEVLWSPEDDDALTARIATAYGRLFLGIGGPATVAPYESAYRGNGRLFGEPVAEMERWLAAADLSLDRRCSEPADHLSVELALISRLVFAGDPASAAMLSRIRDWVPAFCVDCRKRDESGFWAGFASVLAAWIAAQPNTVDMEMDLSVEDRRTQC